MKSLDNIKDIYFSEKTGRYIQGFIAFVSGALLYFISIG